jgi:alpha-tubulin suppressor-like RCC1 family protein
VCAPGCTKKGDTNVGAQPTKDRTPTYGAPATSESDAGVQAPDPLDDGAEVPGLEGVTSIRAGEYHTCALLENGSVKCWSYNALNQLGNSDATPDVDVPWSNVPVAVAGLSTIKQLSAGQATTCGVAASGSVWCWGDNTSSQITADSQPTSRCPKRRLIWTTQPTSQSEAHPARRARTHQNVQLTTSASKAASRGPEPVVNWSCDRSP